MASLPGPLVSLTQAPSPRPLYTLLAGVADGAFRSCGWSDHPRARAVRLPAPPAWELRDVLDVVAGTATTDHLDARLTVENDAARAKLGANRRHRGPSRPRVGRGVIDAHAAHVPYDPIRVTLQAIFHEGLFQGTTVDGLELRSEACSLRIDLIRGQPFDLSACHLKYVTEHRVKEPAGRPRDANGALSDDHVILLDHSCDRYD